MNRLIAMDIETYGELFEDKGCILCCGAHGDGISRVFNFDDYNDMMAVKDILADPTIDKVFHNCLYDTSWLYVKD